MEVGGSGCAHVAGECGWKRDRGEQEGTREPMTVGAKDMDETEAYQQEPTRYAPVGNWLSCKRSAHPLTKLDNISMKQVPAMQQEVIFMTTVV